MAKKITRTITMYKATAYKEEWSEDGSGMRVPYASCEYADVSTTTAEARDALKKAGYKVPRGTHIQIDEIGHKRVWQTVTDFCKNGTVEDID